VDDPYIKVVVAAGAGLCAVVGAWVKARFSRSVWLKIGDVEVKAPTVADVRTLLEVAREFQQRANPLTRRNGDVMEARAKRKRKKEPKL